MEETRNYIVVLDLRKTKKLFMPDKVIQDFEYYLQMMERQAIKKNEYEGVNYLILPKR